MEFLCKTLQITEDELEEIKSSFKIFDTDRDGHITPEELGNVLRLLGGNPSKSELRSMIAELDLDASGTVDFREFLLAQVKKRSETASEEEEIHNAFKSIDENDDGYITVTELQRAMVSLGQNMTRDQAKEVVKQADKNGDGKVDLKEFTESIKKGGMKPNLNHI